MKASEARTNVREFNDKTDWTEVDKSLEPYFEQIRGIAGSGDGFLRLYGRPFDIKQTRRLQILGYAVSDYATESIGHKYDTIISW